MPAADVEDSLASAQQQAVVDETMSGDVDNAAMDDVLADALVDDPEPHTLLEQLACDVSAEPEVPVEIAALDAQDPGASPAPSSRGLNAPRIFLQEPDEPEPQVAQEPDRPGSPASSIDPDALSARVELPAMRLLPAGVPVVQPSTTAILPPPVGAAPRWNTPAGGLAIPPFASALAAEQGPQAPPPVQAWSPVPPSEPEAKGTMSKGFITFMMKRLAKDKEAKEGRTTSSQLSTSSNKKRSFFEAPELAPEPPPNPALLKLMAIAEGPVPLPLPVPLRRLAAPIVECPALELLPPAPPVGPVPACGTVRAPMPPSCRPTRGHGFGCAWSSGGRGRNHGNQLDNSDGDWSPPGVPVLTH